jgi:hypothetical protein
MCSTVPSSSVARTFLAARDLLPAFRSIAIQETTSQRYRGRFLGALRWAAKILDKSQLTQNFPPKQLYRVRFVCSQRHPHS